MNNYIIKQSLKRLSQDFINVDLKTHQNYMASLFKAAMKEKEPEDFIAVFSESVLDYFYLFAQSRININNEEIILKLLLENIIKNPNKIKKAIREDLKSFRITEDIVVFTKKQLCRALYSGKNRPLKNRYSQAWLSLTKTEKIRLISWKNKDEVTYWSNPKYETVEDMIKEWKDNEKILEILAHNEISLRII